jgi:AcrR family transcriptional regulator
MKVEIPLRARKRAQTRLDLVEALIVRLADRTLDEVQVSELADAAGVSQATVFNYFSNKGAILTHFIQLWSLKVSALARQIRAEHESALAAIEALFVSTAEESMKSPRVFLEIVAHQARMPAELEIEPIEYAERVLFLPGEVEVESLLDGGLRALLPELIAEAIARGELPHCANIETLTLAAASIFFGVPIVLAPHAPQAVAPMYRNQLALVWAGAHVLQEKS